MKIFFFTFRSLRSICSVSTRDWVRLYCLENIMYELLVCVIISSTCRYSSKLDVTELRSMAQMS